MCLYPPWIGDRKPYQTNHIWDASPPASEVSVQLNPQLWRRGIKLIVYSLDAVHCMCTAKIMVAVNFVELWLIRCISCIWYIACLLRRLWWTMQVCIYAHQITEIPMTKLQRYAYSFSHQTDQSVQQWRMLHTEFRSGLSLIKAVALQWRVWVTL
jgi:hypothetical protein